MLRFPGSLGQLKAEEGGMAATAQGEPNGSPVRFCSRNLAGPRLDAPRQGQESGVGGWVGLAKTRFASHLL